MFTPMSGVMCHMAKKGIFSLFGNVSRPAEIVSQHIFLNKKIFDFITFFVTIVDSIFTTFIYATKVIIAKPQIEPNESNGEAL